MFRNWFEIFKVFIAGVLLWAAIVAIVSAVIVFGARQ